MPLPTGAPSTARRTSWNGGRPSATPLQPGRPAEGTTRFGRRKKPGKGAPRQPSERTPAMQPIARIASETASGSAVAPRMRGEAEGVMAVFGIPDLASEAPAERAVVVHVGVGAHGERLTEERTRE